MAYEFLKSLSVSAISKYILDQGRNQCQADLHFFRCADELVGVKWGFFGCLIVTQTSGWLKTIT